MTLLKVNDLNVFYIQKEQKFHAVKNINLNLEANRSYGIIGESGSGKSTLVFAILQLLQAERASVSGDIIFEGHKLLQMDSNQLARLRWKEMAVVFQNAMNALSPVHKIKKQLTDVYRLHEPIASQRQIRERMLYLFSLLNLDESIWHSYPHELSGGMLQRVSIAMALMFKPKFLVLDEATTALDIITQNKILQELKAIDEVMMACRIFVTHDLSVVKQSCDHIFIMQNGELIEEGSTNDIFNSPQHPYTKSLVDSYTENLR